MGGRCKQLALSRAQNSLTQDLSRGMVVHVLRGSQPHSDYYVDPKPQLWLIFDIITALVTAQLQEWWQSDQSSQEPTCTEQSNT